jgi:hypothetical protein
MSAVTVPRDPIVQILVEAAALGRELRRQHDAQTQKARREDTPLGSLDAEAVQNS